MDIATAAGCKETAEGFVWHVCVGSKTCCMPRRDPKWEKQRRQRRQELPNQFRPLASGRDTSYQIRSGALALNASRDGALTALWAAHTRASLPSE